MYCFILVNTEMTCSFCGVAGHNKNNCSDPAVCTIQKEYVYAIGRMICSAYIKGNTPVRLLNDIQSWLINCSFGHKKYVLAYLKKHTKLPTTGSLDSAFDTDKNILKIVFTVCNINIEDPRLTDEINVFHFSPRGTRDMMVIPRLGRITDSNTRGCYKEFSNINVYNSRLDNIPLRFQYSPNRWVVISRVPHYTRSDDPNIIDIVLPPSNAPLPIDLVPGANTVIEPGVVLGNGLTVLEFDDVCNHGDECPICYEALVNGNFVKLNCDHKYCNRCIMLCVANGRFTCPMCRLRITTIYSHATTV